MVKRNPRDDKECAQGHTADKVVGLGLETRGSSSEVHALTRVLNHILRDVYIKYPEGAAVAVLFPIL